MQKVDHVQFRLDEVGKGELSINGHPLTSVLGVKVDSGAARLTVVTIDLVATVEADVLVATNQHNITIYDMASGEAKVAKG